ncbi:MAG: hypothetical protein WCY70_04015 [Methanoculleus sp.]
MADTAAIIPPMAVSGLALVLRPISLINSGLLVAGQIIGLIAGALVIVILQKIEPRSPKERNTVRRCRIGSTVTTMIFFTLDNGDYVDVAAEDTYYFSASTCDPFSG